MVLAGHFDGAVIERVRLRKGYQTLADQLREQILSGGLPEGAQLPNERDLGGRSGLSRGSVREALRVLEVEGLVSTRPGRNGGSIIRRPDVEGVSRSLGLFIRGQRIPFDAVLEAREYLEPALASLAALHRTNDDLAAIAVASARMEAARDDNARFLPANTQWHWAVARASGNALMIALIEAIGGVLHRSNVARFVSAEVRDAVIRAHARIGAAIAAGDAAAAHRRMSRHVRSYREQIGPMAPASIVVGDDDETAAP